MLVMPSSQMRSERFLHTETHKRFFVLGGHFFMEMEEEELARERQGKRAPIHVFLCFTRSWNALFYLFIYG